MPWPGIVKMKVFGVFQEPRCSLGKERRMGRPWEVADEVALKRSSEKRLKAPEARSLAKC